MSSLSFKFNQYTKQLEQTLFCQNVNAVSVEIAVSLLCIFFNRKNIGRDAS
jgi:hypothetical protein